MNPKRKEAGEMGAEQLLPANEVYIDGPALVAAVAEFIGSSDLLTMQERMGVSRNTWRRLRDEEGVSMWLETYVRVCRRIRRDVNDFLRG